NTVSAVEEVGIVRRPAGDEEEVLLWAFQGRNGCFRIALQLLQLRMSQPRAIGILGYASCAQGGLQRDAAVAVQPDLGVLLAHASLSQNDSPRRAENDGVIGALVRDPLVGMAHLG